MQGTYLPVAASSVGDGATLRVLDYRREALTSTPAGADGLIVCEFDGPDPGRFWLLERITVTTTSSASTSCDVYAGAVAPANLIDSTYLGNGDVADESSPVLIESAQPVTVQWRGASTGARGTVTLQYQLVERVA